MDGLNDGLEPSLFMDWNISGVCNMKNYFDRNGVMLAHNDLVEVTTEDIGTHEGYIRYFGAKKIKVNCLVGELWVASNRIQLIRNINCR